VSCAQNLDPEGHNFLYSTTVRRLRSPRSRARTEKTTEGVSLMRLRACMLAIAVLTPLRAFAQTPAAPAEAAPPPAAPPPAVAPTPPPPPPEAPPATIAAAP